MQINFQKYAVDEKEQKIVFSCCSDTPYTRCEDGVVFDEILIINENTVDLSRLQNGAPVLFSHDNQKIIGIVDRAFFGQNKIFVEVRFRKNDQFSMNIYRDILDGTIKNVSIGYEILDFEDVKEDGKNKRYVNKFLIFEVSIVGAPADDTVGIRSFQIKDKKQMENLEDKIKNLEEQLEELKAKVALEDKDEGNEEDAQTAPQDEAEGEEKVEAEEKAPQDAEEDTAQPEDAVEAEEDAEEVNEDEEEIKAIGKDFNVSEQEIKSAIDEKLTVREFKNKIKSLNFNNNNNNKKEKNMTEFRKFLQSGNNGSFTLKRDYTGFGAQVGEAGAGLVSTQTMPIVAALAKKMGVKGYRTISGLVGQITIPVQTGRQQVKFKSFHNPADETNPAFTNKTLTPNLLTGECRIGRDLLLQCNDDVQSFVVDSLTRSIAEKLEDYMLSKVTAGAANTVTYSALSAIDWNDILAFEAYTGAFDLETAFVMSPAARAALKGIEKAQNTARFICEDNEINGYAVNVSGCVSNNNIFFGDWSKLILAVFGEGLQIDIDNVTYNSYGDTKIVARIAVDACIEDANAFVLGKVQESSSSSGQA